jgi:hypothetical protein
VTPDVNDDDLTPGQRGILDLIAQLGFPLTRETFIEINWNGEPPDPWTAEDEAELPEFLQQ